MRECLASLERHTNVDNQTIVVDGASFDNCGEMIECEFPWVEFIQSEINYGFGGCNNLGVSKANGEFLLLLNPDTEVHPGALESMLNVIERDPAVGLVGACLLNSNGTVQTSCVQALPTPLNRALDSNFLRKLLPKSSMWGSSHAFCSKAPVKVDAVSGACMLMRRETFVEAGGFPTYYFMYGEDMHLCWMISNLGRDISFDPNALVTHHGGGASGGDFTERSTIEMRRSVHRFIKHRQGEAAGHCYRILMGLSATVRMALLGLGLIVLPQGNRRRILHSIRTWYATFRWSLRSV